jgi:hypothetical protein
MDTVTYNPFAAFSSTHSIRAPIPAMDRTYLTIPFVAPTLMF